MHGTLFFVHGTGVRLADHDASLEALRRGASLNGLEGVDVVGCPWGEQQGVRIDLVNATLPTEVSTKAITDRPLSEQEVEVARWALLLEDPLFELRVAGESGQADGSIVVGGLRQDQEVLDMVKGLQNSQVDLSDTGISPAEFRVAVTRIADADELGAAASAAPRATDPELVESIARAVVAAALIPHRSDAPGAAPRAAVSQDVRDALVKRVYVALAPGATKDIGDWIKNKVIGFAKSKATSMLTADRPAIAGLSMPKVGDVIFYLRRGAEISQFVAERLDGLPRPVVALGHSLGGIILVDLLSRPAAPSVDLLVTIGSQSPLLYAIDALEHLRREQATPHPFTPWLNIYNRNDLLSFRATGVFPGVDGIRDEEINPGIPFPEAHGSYFEEDRVYQLIRDAWPSA